MALETHSKFYYGYEITSENQYLDIYDGTSNISITLDIKSYTTDELAAALASKLTAAAVGDYTVTFNRATRKFTISGTVTFSLLFATGDNFFQSFHSLLGFNDTDLTGSTSYTSQIASGKSYSTQFYMQSYKPTALNKRSIDSVINESASGVIEAIKFGDKRFLEGELLFITDIIQNDVSIVRTNTSGVADYISLIEWLVDKKPVEIMIDENKVNEYQVFLLESTELDSKGMDYELIELYDRSLPLYYRSGKLKFRLLE